MTDKDNFEERLLTELRQVVAERPAPAEAKRPAWRPARFALAGGGLAAVVAAIAIFASSGSNTPNAYAVDTKADGAVTVKIKSLKDADGLEASLREAGIPAVVDYSPVMAGDDCVGGGKFNQETETAPAPANHAAEPVRRSVEEAPLGKVAPDGYGRVSAMSSDDRGTTFTVDPGTIQEGQNLYITTSTWEGKDSGMKAESVSMSIGTKAAIPVC